MRADGRPHVTPLVAVWDDGAVHFCTGEHEQKALNLAANPNVALTTGTNDGTPASTSSTRARRSGLRPRPADHARRGVAAKWDGQWTFSVGEGGFTHSEASTDIVHVYRVQPTRAFAFGKAPASQTT